MWPNDYYLKQILEAQYNEFLNHEHFNASERRIIYIDDISDITTEIKFIYKDDLSENLGSYNVIEEYDDGFMIELHDVNNKEVHYRIDFVDFVLGNYLSSNQLFLEKHKFDNQFLCDGYFRFLLLEHFEQIKSSFSLNKNLEMAYLDSQITSLNSSFDRLLKEIVVEKDRNIPSLMVFKISNLFSNYFKEEYEKINFYESATSKIAFTINQSKVSTLLALLIRARYFDCSDTKITEHFSKYFSYYSEYGNNQSGIPLNFNNLQKQVSKAKHEIQHDIGSSVNNMAELLTKLSE